MDVHGEPVGAGGEQEVPAPGGFEKRALVVAEMKRGFELGRLAWTLRPQEQKRWVGGHDRSLV
jgi:hypothetical protein